jgi:zinc protease
VPGTCRHPRSLEQRSRLPQAVRRPFHLSLAFPRMHTARFALLPLLLIVALCAGLPGQARELERRADWPHATSDLTPDPAVVWGRLDNGMRYVLMPNNTPRDRISLRLVVDAGSLMEADDQRGLAHFLEHMAFKGTQNMPAGDLVQYLERLGMAFGADTNARTSYDSTVYQLELPSNDNELVDRSLFVLREKVDRLLIPAPDVERERGVILSEKRLRNTSQFRAMDANLAFLFPDTLVSKRSPIGTEEVLTTAPPERLERFYRDYYTPSRTTLVAVGAIDPERFAERIRAHFGDFRARGETSGNPDLGQVRNRGLEARLHYEPEGRTNVALQAVKPLEPQPDVHARRVHDLNLYVAHAIIGRRLSTLALQPDAPFLSGGAYSDDFLDFARIGSITINTRPERWRDGVTVAEQELRRALTHGFTESEIDEQVRTLVTQFEQNLRAAATRESDDLAEQVVSSLIERHVFTSPEQDMQELRRMLARMTPESILAAARELWSDSGPLIMVSGPVQMDDPQAAIAQAYRTSQTQAVAPPERGAVQQFAYQDFGGDPKVVARKVTDVLEVTQLRFANNVRVNLKRTDFEANSIVVAVRVGGGRLELPQDKPGLEQLAKSAFTAGGLGEHTMDELNRITAGRTVGMGFDVEDDAFILAGRTTPDDLQLQMQLLAAYLVDPAYRPEALARFRQGLPQLYQSLERTPMGVLQKEVVRYLRSGDPRFGYPEQAVLASRTLEELRSVLSAPLSRGYLEVSIVGDFDMEQAIQAVSSTFGSLPQRQADKPAFDAARAVRFPQTHALTTFAYETSDPKALAAVYFPTTDFSQLQDVRRLFVLAKVLGSRVLERVRNMQGLTYTAQGDHAPSQVFPGYGFLYAVVDAPPQKSRALAEEIVAIAGELYRDGVTPDELERARNPVVSELRRMLSNNSYLLSAIISGSQERPDKLARAATSLKEISSLTVADLNQVARKYLDPERALPVVIMPREAAKTTTLAPTAAPSDAGATPGGSTRP